MTAIPAWLCLLATVFCATSQSTVSQGPLTSRTGPGIDWGGRDSITLRARPLIDGSEPSISPDGRLVAFTRNGTSIWLYDLRTSKARLLRNCGNAHDPSWDPSGRHIVFFGNPGTWDSTGEGILSPEKVGNLDSYGIWIINSDGTSLHKLPEGNGHDRCPHWSRDGKWIAWTRENQIWLSDTAGVERRALTSESARKPEVSLSWSTDGALLYAASVGGPEFVSELPQSMRRSPDGAYVYQGVCAMPAALLITELGSGKSRAIVLEESGCVGKLAIANDQTFIVYDGADSGDELISIVRLR